MNATPTAATARRARALAGALTAFTVLPEQRTARQELVRSLRDVSLALTVLPAPATDGPPRMPAPVRDELARVMPLLGAYSGVPAHVMTYVLEPLTGRSPKLPELEPSDDQHVREELRIRDRITVVRRHLDSEHESILRACFLGLLAAHSQLLVLGAAIAEDRQPCHQ